MPVTSLPPAQDTELALSVERAYRESLVTDRLGALWSLILAKCFLAQWAIGAFAIPVSGPLYVWALTLIMGAVASLYYLHAHRVRLHLLPTHFRVNAAVLAGLWGVGLIELLRMMVYLVFAVVLGSAVLSWVSPHAPLAPLLHSIAAPFLRPFRRVIPSIANVDLSPLVLLLVLQIVLMVLAGARNGFAPLLFGG